MIDRFNHFLNKYLSWLVLIVAIVAFFFNSYFIWAAKNTVLLLQIIMFGMGLTMQASDFAAVFRKPWQVLLVSVMQFGWMPFAGYLLTQVFAMPPEIAVGVILVGAAPGGTASNVMTYLARGDVALSVAATSVSTLLAPIFTPLFVQLYAGAIVPVDFMAMFMSIIKVVVIPIGGGVILNYFLGERINKFKTVLPSISTVGVLLVIMGVVSVNKATILTSGLLMFLICFLHNVSGYVLAFGVCKALQIDTAQRRAMQIEVGMQNSGLASTLALAHFTPPAALAGAIFSIIHNFTGSVFAGICRRNDEQHGR